MTDFNKTKKELILELQKLQQQHYLLETSFDRGVFQQKKTAEALKASLDYLNKIIYLSVLAPNYFVSLKSKQI